MVQQNYIETKSDTYCFSDKSGIAGDKGLIGIGHSYIELEVMPTFVT
jgi:hypothetical protein